MLNRLLFVLVWILKQFDKAIDKKEQKEHEQKVKEYRDNPADTFKRKFGRVQPDTSGESDVRDAPDADKTRAGRDS